MLITLLATVIVVAIAFTAMAVRILLKKNGYFPQTKIGHNKKMREKGIECAFSQDYKAYHQIGSWKKKPF
ncbi:MAG: hypothetical protein GXO86_00820 [Chlorobi bacterium]|nr:hypothetical protein [Chlorobiota bacterium]